MSFQAIYSCIHCGWVHTEPFKSFSRPLPLVVDLKCQECGCTRADRPVRGIDIDILLDRLSGAVAGAMEVRSD
jgi:hypothetical protein